MTIDWEKFDAEIETLIDQAADRTDEKLASKISSITRLTDEEIMELFPKPADARKLKELIKVVKSAEDRNIKINNIIANIEDFAEIIIPLLGKLA
jgi:hypothetical protein